MATEGTGLDQISKSIGAVSILAGLVVTMNTLMTTCTSQRVARHSDFRDSVAREEEAWKDLYDDYLTLLDGSQSRSEKYKRVKLYAIANLAQRAIPSFDEYEIKGEASTARTRLAAMRNTLLNNLRDPLASDPVVAAALQRTAFHDEQAATIPRPEDGSILQVSRDAIADPQSADFSYLTRTFSASRAGTWDVDIFWCQGDNQQYRFGVAQALASTLAERARSHALLGVGSDVGIGRVRVRVLPQGFETSPDVPVQGPTIEYGDSLDERKAATAVLAEIGRRSATFRFSLARGSNASPWHLRAFVCNARNQ